MSTDAYIGVTMGDPSGIGPEIIASALHHIRGKLRSRLLIFCDSPILDRAFAQVWGVRLPKDLRLVDRGRLEPDQALPGEPSAAGAEAQVAYLEAAVAAARGGTLSALVTAPINKRQAQRAGFAFPGHTEFLAHRLGAAGPVAMMFAGLRLRVVLATVHVPLAQVPGLLTIDGVTLSIRMAVEALERDFGVSPVRVGVIGLNPHAGEGGLFGREEVDIIEPAIERARWELGQRASIAGPLVPDVAFRAGVRGDHDVLVAMYHDQALIPVKLIDFADAVNVTLGLPIVRTSPDHGVAYDIAGLGRAQAHSFIAAVKLAAEIADRRMNVTGGGDAASVAEDEDEDEDEDEVNDEVNDQVDDEDNDELE